MTHDTALWADPTLYTRPRTPELSGLLAAARRGIGKQAGTVPEMWPLHRLTIEDDDGTRRSRQRFDAEHHTLTLWAVHQQGHVRDGAFVPVHHAQGPTPRGIGHLAGELVRPTSDGRPTFSVAAVERRFHRAVLCQSLDALVHNLRGLIQQATTLSPRPHLNYTELFDQLAAWPYPDRQRQLRRAWGRQFQQTLNSHDNRQEQLA